MIPLYTLTFRPVHRAWSTTSSSPRPTWASWGCWDRWTASGSSTTPSRAAPTPTSPRTTSPCWPSWSCTHPCPTRSPPLTGCTCRSTGSECSPAEARPPPLSPSPLQLYAQDPVQFTMLRLRHHPTPTFIKEWSIRPVLLLFVFLHTVNVCWVLFYFFQPTPPPTPPLFHPSENAWYQMLGLGWSCYGNPNVSTLQCFCSDN